MPARSQLWLLAMQFLSRVSADLPPAHKERAVAAHVPYIRHIDDNTLMLRGDMLVQCIKLDGLLFETADSDELNYRASLRAALLRAIGSSRLAVYHHLIRREVALDRDGPFADGFAKLVDERWNAQMQSRKLYTNELFLTIVRRPPPFKPLDVERDPNGVDLLSGKAEQKLPSISVPGAPKLEFSNLDQFLCSSKAIWYLIHGGSKRTH